MRRSVSPPLIAGLIAVLQAGCGTLHNLHAPPKDPPFEGAIGSGPGVCIPFGGVARSAMLGGFGPVAGVGAMIDGELSLVRGDDPKEAITKIGRGAWLAGAGLVALADTPLSLAGDIVTYPVACARQHEHSWATWWGREGGACWLPKPSGHGQSSNKQRDPSEALEGANLKTSDRAD